MPEDPAMEITSYMDIRLRVLKNVDTSVKVTPSVWPLCSGLITLLVGTVCQNLCVNT